MKKLTIMTVMLMGVSTFAHAQSQGREQQVYRPYNLGPAMTDPVIQEKIISAQEAGTRRIYPGREAYGRDFGPIPRHPGDYRDAVDRGQWNGGNVGSRSFSIE